MPSLLELQQGFMQAVFAADDAALARWIDPGGPGPSARLAVYRNNVFHNLREALRDVFPVIERLVGREFFAAAADRFIRAAPSRSGDLHRFGDRFAAFLAGYAPASGLPYLADTAQLEWRVHLAFHAADHAALPLDRLGALPADDYGRLVFRLHPSCHLLASPYPVHRIWRVNQPDHSGDERVNLSEAAARVVVRRSGFAVEVVELSAGEFCLLDRFAAGVPLAQATESACALEPGFDLSAGLHRHVAQGTLVDFELAPTGCGDPEPATA